MKGRYNGSSACQTAERSLYSPDYDELLEKRFSKSCSRKGNGKARTEKSKRKRFLSPAARSCYKKRLLQLLAAAIVVAFLFGAVGVHADPKDVTCSEDEFIYAMITVEYGDTLWDIAKVFSQSTDDDIRTYMNRVCEMNHIHGDNLKAGQTLLIYYGQSMAGQTLEVAGN